MKIRFMLLPLAGFLAACAPQHYAKEGGTAAEFKRDNYECDRDARQTPASNAFWRMAFYQECLESKGYTRTQ